MDVLILRWNSNLFVTLHSPTQNPENERQIDYNTVTPSSESNELASPEKNAGEREAKAFMKLSNGIVLHLREISRYVLACEFRLYKLILIFIMHQQPRVSMPAARRELWKTRHFWVQFLLLQAGYTSGLWSLLLGESFERLKALRSQLLKLQIMQVKQPSSLVPNTAERVDSPQD